MGIYVLQSRVRLATDDPLQYELGLIDIPFYSEWLVGLLISNRSGLTSVDQCEYYEKFSMPNIFGVVTVGTSNV